MEYAAQYAASSSVVLLLPSLCGAARVGWGEKSLEESAAPE